MQGEKRVTRVINKPEQMMKAIQQLAKAKAAKIKINNKKTPATITKGKK